MGTAISILSALAAVAPLLGGSAGVPGRPETGTPAEDRPRGSGPVESAPVDFDVDVMPILTRAGCNSCHGASGGRGGFQLSLFGGDPAADHAAIVHDLEGRRVDLARPEASLFLRKPTGELSHGGGKRLEPDGEEAALLARWIEEGARRIDGPRLTELELRPDAPRLDAPGATVELSALAIFDDGSRRDVTRWTVFDNTDPGALEVSGDGEVTALRRGRSVVIARYLSAVVPAVVTTPFGEPRPAPRPQDSPQRNLVDRHLDAELAALGLEPAGPVSDGAFLRRARLALTGTLPTREEAVAFLADDDPAKRETLVDALLASGDFVDYWTYRLATLLRVRAVTNEPPVARGYRAWLREAVAENRPLDELVRALVTAEGDSHEPGPAGFYRMQDGPREDAELFSEALLGMRLRCANCHDHPLDRWTQDDYHGLAAVFSRVDRGRVVTEREYGQVTHPRTGEPATPRLPGERFLEDATGAREELAAWLTTEASLPLAKNLANRLWAALFGRGLVEPLDDLRATNPALHPALLDALARELVDTGFDLRRTLRLLATSDAFGRAAPPADAPEPAALFGAGALERPLEAEVLADAMVRVTGVPDDFPDVPTGTRAIALDPTVPSRGLDLLGRCDLESTCAGPPAAPGLAGLLHLVNGELVNEKISARRGRLGELLAAGASDGEIVEELTLRALSRRPTPAEIEFWLAELGAARSDRERARILEDFLWSLLTCREFETNH